VGVVPLAAAGRSDVTAENVWREIGEAVLARMESVSAEFREIGISPGHVRTLLVLDPDDPKPMKWLADRHVLDPSTVTWTVDRLEELKLVQRRPMEGGSPGQGGGFDAARQEDESPSRSCSHRHLV